MIVVIIAAGQAKRLRPLTETRLKGSLPILNEPLLLRIVDMIHQAKLLDKVILVVSKGQEEGIRDLFSQREYYSKLVVTIQDPPKGTADAVAKAESYIGDAENFLAMNGDILTPLEEVLPNLLERHKELKAKCSMVGFPGEGSRYGLFTITDDGRVENLKEKSTNSTKDAKQGYINAGIYFFPVKIFDIIKQTPLSERNEYEITDSISLLGEEGSIGAIETTRWMSIENAIDLFNAQLFFTPGDEQSNLQFHAGGEIGLKAAEDLFFDKDTEMNFSGVKIIGPALIGKGTLIEANSEIGPRVFIGRNCELGSGVHLQEALLMDDVKIGQKSAISSFLCGEEVILGSNVVIHPIEITPEMVKNLRNRERLEDFLIVGGKAIIASNLSITKGGKVPSHAALTDVKQIK